MKFHAQIFCGDTSVVRTFRTKAELAALIQKQTSGRRCDSIAVSTEDSRGVMPVAWIRREWDEELEAFGLWRGFEGDGKKLGLRRSQILEDPTPIVLSLEDAVEQGWAQESVEGTVRVVQFDFEGGEMSRRATEMAQALLRGAK